MRNRPIAHHRIEADGVQVFYREAGPADAPVVLLLHGFPTSSFQYRELIPLLADRYHVIAPDLPGFGFTEVPASRGYRYTFDALAQTIGAELPGVTLRTPEATYLAWLDCSALELPMSAGQFFLDRARVGLNFGETFGTPYAGFARLNFATPAPILREIVSRMAEAARRR